MIAFRVDGNYEIGSGHIMRCLSVATALREEGQNSIFVTADHLMDAVISNAGFSSCSLDTNWNDMESELAKIQWMMQALKPDKIIVDHYSVTPRYFEQLNKIAKAWYIDDLNIAYYCVEGLINYNVFAKDLGYENMYSEQTELLLGAIYAPLRKEFLKMPARKVNTEVHRILILTGGSDPVRVSQQILSFIKKNTAWNQILFDFVVGMLNPQLFEIQKQAQKLPNVEIHTNVNKMSELMMSCDIAVSAAGSTLYELCACGTPTITYSLADNQKLGAQAFSTHKMMLDAGDCRENLNFEQNLEDCINNMIQNLNLRMQTSKLLQQSVDGNGAARIAKILIEKLSTSI